MLNMLKTVFVCVVIFSLVLIYDTSQQQSAVTGLNAILYAIKNNLSEYIKEKTCQTCQVYVDMLIQERKKGGNKTAVAEILKTWCGRFTDWGKVACAGYINIEIDTMLYILDNRKNLTSARICAIHFQKDECVDPQANKWNIPLPPPPSDLTTNEICEVNGTNLRILQLTDVHFDPLYKPGSNAQCDLPLCCQGEGKPSKNRTEPAGYWGSYEVCDMPWHSVTNLVYNINEKYVRNKSIDYIYYTGDIISHKSWATNQVDNTAAIKAVYGLLRSNFKNIPVYPILGNHEPNPTDFYSPLSVKVANVSTNWIFDLAAEEWKDWLPQSAIDTVRKGGFYTVLVKPKFRIIALNSNVCFVSNLWLVYTDVDPYDQLKWLVEELSKAEKNGEHVHILSHIPPGDILCHKQWNYQFNRIVRRFAKTISAQFNGHTHLDEFRVFYDKNKKPINVAFNGGSFTTFVGFNPNFRFYDVNTENYVVTDYDHYIYNLTKANETPDKPPQWYKLYSFKQAYGLPDLSLQSFDGLIRKMANNTALLQQYFRFQVRESDILMKSGCDKRCLKSLYCYLTAVETSETILCQK